jgi:hypothetical protein
MNEIKNLKEAKKLVSRYREISLEDIEMAVKSPECNTKYSRGESFLFKAANYLTGFGNISTCSLCLAAGKINDREINCDVCIHSTVGDYYPCVEDVSYEKIMAASTSGELLQAFRNRADYLEMIIWEYEREAFDFYKI